MRGLTLNFRDLYLKANTALKSARLLMEAQDYDGACNRAYYAMHDAAKAALYANNPSPEILAIKTHSGLINTFSQQLVKSELVPLDLGKSFNKIEDLRLIADYRGDSITQEHCSWAIEEACRFVKTLEEKFK